MDAVLERVALLLALALTGGALLSLPTTATAAGEEFSFDRAFGVGVNPGGGAGFENCTTASGCQAATASGAAGGMDTPSGVAVDAQGRILVTDFQNNRIDRFTVAGDGTVSFDRAFGLGVDTGGAAFENCTADSSCQAGIASGAAGGLDGPSGVAVDGQGRIVVADFGNNRIARFAVAGDGTVSFDRAFGVGVDTGGAAFESCTTGGGCLAGIASGAAGGLDGPSGVAVDAEGRIVVADADNSRIARFAVAGDGTVSFDRAFGVGVDPGGGGEFESCTTGSGCQAGTTSAAAGGMDVPSGVAVDTDGRILVADTFINRIDRFAVAGDGTVSFDRAFGVGVDTGGAAFENCTTASGCQLGTFSTAAGAMDSPRGVAVDAEGRILVADTFINRIDRFEVAGDGTVSFDSAFGVGVETGAAELETCTAASGCQPGTGTGAAGGMNLPFGVAVDAQGRIVVADSDNARIDRFTAPSPPPSLDASAKKKQPAKKLKIRVTSDQDATLDVEGQAKVPRRGPNGRSGAASKAKKFSLKPRSVELQGGVTKTVRLKFKRNKKSVAKITKLLRTNKKARKGSKVIAKATATNANGSSPATKLKIKLRK